MIEGPSVKEFYPDPTLDLWYFGPSGGRHVSGHAKPSSDAAAVDDEQIMDMTKRIPVDW